MIKETYMVIDDCMLHHVTYYMLWNIMDPIKVNILLEVNVKPSPCKI